MPSRREQIRMSDQEMREYLGQAIKGTLSTLGPAEFPHQTAVSFVWLQGDCIGIASYARSQKVKNLLRIPRSSFIAEADASYSSYRGVLVTGVVDVTTKFEDVARFQRLLIQRVTKLSEGSHETPVDPESIAAKRAVLTLRLQKIITWDHSTLEGVY
jgi:nitroimidazol reductase NimA-like FMN-containing flavoprotein (pyridoxamine 5'-phosphate oxidase superfamily)